eukprot:5191344-Amphidinium_carterae.1
MAIAISQLRGVKETSCQNFAHSARLVLRLEAPASQTSTRVTARIWKRYVVAKTAGTQRHDVYSDQKPNA